MRPLLWTILTLAAATTLGCGPRCGSFEVHTDYEYGSDSDGWTAMDFDNAYEYCGEGFGSFGSFDLVGDGVAWLNFIPDHADSDIYWALTQVFMHLAIDNTTLVREGPATITGGYAEISAGGIGYAGAGLEDGASLEVLEVGELDPPCTPFRQQLVRLRWDARYSNAGGEWYAAEGTDWVHFFYEDEEDLLCD